MAFDYVQNLVEQARDDNHEVYLAGQPALTGWVYRLQKQTYNIFRDNRGRLDIGFNLLYAQCRRRFDTCSVCRRGRDLGVWFQSVG